MLSFLHINIVPFIRTREEKKLHAASFSSQDMWTERTTGSVCEVNGVRPSFLKRLQRPVSRTAHFNVSVSGLQEGQDWPLYKARSVKNPPTFPHTHRPKAPSHTLNYLRLMLVFLFAGVNFLLFFSRHFWNSFTAFVWMNEPQCSGKMTEWVPTLDGGVWDDTETLTQVTTGSAALESTCTHVHTPAWKLPSNEGSTHHYKPPASPPIYPTARPPDLVSHCSFGELSKPSFTVKRHERLLTLSLSWWLTFTTPPIEAPPATTSKSSTLNSLEGVVRENTRRIKKHNADWEDERLTIMRMKKTNLKTCFWCLQLLEMQLWFLCCWVCGRISSPPVSFQLVPS